MIEMMNAARAAKIVADFARYIEVEAAIRAFAEAGNAIAAFAMPPPRPAYRHRRGRGISRSAKRRHARAVQRWIARPRLHQAASRAWSGVADMARATLNANAEAA